MNLFIAFHLDVSIIDVGGTNPKGVFCIGAVGENAGVVGGVGDEDGYGINNGTDKCPLYVL